MTDLARKLQSVVEAFRGSYPETLRGCPCGVCDYHRAAIVKALTDLVEQVAGDPKLNYGQVVIDAMAWVQKELEREWPHAS